MQCIGRNLSKLKIYFLSFQVPEATDYSSNLIKELERDIRFHPSIMGSILILFLFSASVFISHMESITYFDAFYACIISYSTIGFGDIDIFVSHFWIFKYAFRYSRGLFSIRFKRHQVQGPHEVAGQI